MLENREKSVKKLKKQNVNTEKPKRTQKVPKNCPKNYTD